MSIFNKAAAELTGRADICDVLRPATFGAADSFRYLLTEDGETPVFILRSKQDEYCFTDRALVHLDGTSAMSKKRQVHRFNFSTHEFSSVRIETAGVIDLDIEIKFNLGGREYSLDVAKAELDALTAFYKALVAIADIQARGNRIFDMSKLALDRAAGSLSRGIATAPGADGRPLHPGVALVETTDAALSWLANAYTVHNPSNFGHVFTRYLNKLA